MVADCHHHGIGIKYRNPVAAIDPVLIFPLPLERVPVVPVHHALVGRPALLADLPDLLSGKPDKRRECLWPQH